MPKLVTDATRISEVTSAVAKLPDALAVAQASGQKSDWLIVANLAGIAQRRSRPLAGLSKGG